MNLAKTGKIATALVNSGALRFGTFKLKSGQTSPFYIDLARLLSSPRDFQCVVDAIVDEVKTLQFFQRIDKLASIELKGALIAPSVAAKLDLPCLIVRKESKAYGVTGRTAGGEVRKGEHVLFIDDVVTDGQSKVEGVKPLLDQGAKVNTILVVIDREQGGKQNLEKLGIQLFSLTSISRIVKALAKAEKISKEQAETILSYIKKH
jgi:orotate phosphoribosyltransferase